MIHETGEDLQAAFIGGLYKGFLMALTVIFMVLSYSTCGTPIFWLWAPLGIVVSVVSLRCSLISIHKESKQ